MARTVVTYDAGTWDVAGAPPASSPVTVTDAALSTSDITTNNVTTAKHGFTPKLPNDATKYLDGTGAYSVPAGGAGAVSSVFGRTGAVVAATNDYSEAQLSFTDVTTNNVTSTKHGFVPKSPGVAAQFLNGAATPAFARPPGSQLDYVTQSSDLTVTATSAATAQAFLTGNAVTYDGTAVILEWWSANVNSSGGGILIAELYDGATDQSLRLGQAGPGGQGFPMGFRYLFTPSAASHTYSIKFWRATANGVVQGTGGGIYPAAWLRVTAA